MGEGIDFALNPTPVVSLAPVFNELPEVREISAVAPVIVGELRSEASTCEPFVEIVENSLRDFYPELFLAHRVHLVTTNWRRSRHSADGLPGSRADLLEEPAFVILKAGSFLAAGCCQCSLLICNTLVRIEMRKYVPGDQFERIHDVLMRYTARLFEHDNLVKPGALKVL